MSDIFSAISILLVFATVSLDLFIKDSQIFLHKSKPDESKTKETTKYNSERESVLCKLSGLLVFYILLFWLLVPKSFEIVKTSEIHFWNFDMISTFYVLINFCILFFIILTIKYVIKTKNK